MYRPDVHTDISLLNARIPNLVMMSWPKMNGVLAFVGSPPRDVYFVSLLQYVVLVCCSIKILDAKKGKRVGEGPHVDAPSVKNLDACHVYLYIYDV